MNTKKADAIYNVNPLFLLYTYYIFVKYLSYVHVINWISRLSGY